MTDSLSVRCRLESRMAADLVVVPVLAAAGHSPVEAGCAGTEGLPVGRLVAALGREPRFSGETGEIAPVMVAGDDGPDLMAVGLGTEICPATLRDAAQAAGEASLGRGRIAFLMPLPVTAEGVRAVAEGFLLGRFRPEGADDPSGTDDTIGLVVPPAGAGPDCDLGDALHIGLAAGRAAGWVRHLVDLPPGRLPPQALARHIAGRARDLGIAAEIWDRDALIAHGFEATAAVGAGSANPPCALVLRTPCPAGRRPFGLAGKGMTFDAGGLNLKQDFESIFRMKEDMAGAAAVAGAVFAATELGCDLPLIAVLPMAENMPSGSALRPGDVVRHPDGQATEIVDTDCEGRLVLADALAWLRQQDVCGLIDVGTLTDCEDVGPLMWACWASDTPLARAVLAAGREAGEPGWRLPLRAEYEALLHSRVADRTNTSFSHPDAGLTAATFLAAFAGDTPWVHIDNGPDAYLEEDIGVWREGPTGAPVRALLQFLLHRARQDS